MGLGRTLQRNQEKAAYKKFQKAWNKEQRYQQHVIDQYLKDNPDVTMSRLQAAEKALKNPLLRRKPTFEMWKKIAVSAKAKAEAKPDDVQEFADENDLAWNEDEEKGEVTQEK